MNLYLERSLELSKDLLQLAIIDVWMDVLMVFTLYLNCEADYKVYSNSISTWNILTTDKAVNLYQENLLDRSTSFVPLGPPFVFH